MVYSVFHVRYHLHIGVQLAPSAVFQYRIISNDSQSTLYLCRVNIHCKVVKNSLLFGNTPAPIDTAFPRTR